jgi:hypothetical protein
VEEHAPDIGAGVLRFSHEASVHVGVTARLVNEQASDVIGVVEGITSLGQDRVALKRRGSVPDDAEGFPRGVVIDGGDAQGFGHWR